MHYHGHKITFIMDYMYVWIYAYMDVLARACVSACVRACVCVCACACACARARARASVRVRVCASVRVRVRVRVRVCVRMTACFYIVYIHTRINAHTHARNISCYCTICGSNDTFRAQYLKLKHYMRPTCTNVLPECFWFVFGVYFDAIRHYGNYVDTDHRSGNERMYCEATLRFMRVVLLINQTISSQPFYSFHSTVRPR